MSDYNGGRTGNDIVQWALEQLAENIPAPDVIQVQLYLYIFSFVFYDVYQLFVARSRMMIRLRMLVIKNHCVLCRSCRTFWTARANVEMTILPF